MYNYEYILYSNTRSEVTQEEDVYLNYEDIPE